MPVLIRQVYYMPMNEPLKLMCLFAHPDDETLSTGGILCKYAAEGIETSLVCATRGERGWVGNPEDYPGPQKLGQIREAELRCAGEVLGLKEIIFLDYIDGDLDQADPAEAIAKIVQALRRIRPQVVVTMDPQGVYGHPDHIAMAQYAQAAIVQAASTSDSTQDLSPHTVSKLYLVAEASASLQAFSYGFGGEIRITVDGIERTPNAWRNWEISAVIDTCPYWDQVTRAMACHKSQLPELERFTNMPRQYGPEAWGLRTYYRAFSLVNGGRAKETDLFTGLRDR